MSSPLLPLRWYFPRSITILINQGNTPLNVFPSKNAFKYEEVFGRYRRVNADEAPCGRVLFCLFSSIDHHRVDPLFATASNIVQIWDESK